ncbi:carbohydrate kinase family protein [Ahrensia marina]|uniref:carbohydrate kinase family protein n=1 Tax=Ahrensia marina TaxID=1514904 RepID=UPI0006B49930|nr:PfkB family carbohydrate kinase [Ahrensia marina]
MTSPALSNAILCAGRLYCDLVFTGVPKMPAMNTEIFCDDVSLHAGGGAYITAAAFNALGWEACLLATLPASPFDTIVLRDIRKSGVATTHCKAAAYGDKPQITVAITGDDDRAFLSHKTGAALPDISIAEGTFRHLHIGELRSLIEHPDLVEKARDNGMTISVDCGWDEALMKQGSSLQPLLEKIDVFLPNESEYAHLVESGLREGAVPLTVVKCGGDGARALRGGKWISEPTVKTTVVDATGAGDAFNGGFLSSWLLGKVLDECLANGNRCGSASVQQAGGTGGLSRLRSEFGNATMRAAQ